MSYMPPTLRGPDRASGPAARDDANAPGGTSRSNGAGLRELGRSRSGLGVHSPARFGDSSGALEVHPSAGRGCMPGARHKSVVELFGVPPVPKSGRERLVAAAIELFYRKGFGAVGIDQVIAAAGVTKSTFYKHFESKVDLMVAAVQRRDEWELEAWGRAV